MKFKWRIFILVFLMCGLLGVSCYVIHLNRIDFNLWPVDPSGFEIESLPFPISSSYVQGETVYLADAEGNLFRGNESDFPNSIRSIGISPFLQPLRLLFVSTKGTHFIGGEETVVLRSIDQGETWTQSLATSVWRMEEDDLGNLYAGNYTKNTEAKATVYKSPNDGIDWEPIFSSPGNHHIHTVRWDGFHKRLYIAYGDGPTRGQAVSMDRGDHFLVLAEGPTQGHTDAAITPGAIYWGSDDGSGTLYRMTADGRTESLFGRSQFIWWMIADHSTIYAGTMPSMDQQQACLLASRDGGETWQKLIQLPESRSAYDGGFHAESRQASANGWIYFSAADRSFRVRSTR